MIDGQSPGMRHLEIMWGPRPHTWHVRYENDTTVLSDHATRAEAITAARSHARQFGVNVIHIYDMDGEQKMIALEPEHDAPRFSDVKGPPAG